MLEVEPVLRALLSTEFSALGLDTLRLRSGWDVTAAAGDAVKPEATLSLCF